jgi:regulator of RNase E activity RraA
MKNHFFIFVFAFSVVIQVKSQLVKWTPDDIQLLTKDWVGERTPDGRPKVSDTHLKRLEKVSIEEAYEFLRAKGYENQFENFSGTYENSWVIIHPDQPMIGRVLTAQYMPMRFDYDDYLQEVGKKQGIDRVNNSLPVNSVSEGDVYVADAFGKIIDGTLLGDAVGGAVYKNSKRGVILNGSVRKLDALTEMKGFNGWIRGFDPSSISHMVCASVNAPIRIGRVTVLPGDVVIARRSGVIFIPPHFIAELILSVEMTALRNNFNLQRQEGKIDSGTDFRAWLKRQTNLPVTDGELDAYFEQQADRQANPQANPQPNRSQRQ